MQGTITKIIRQRGFGFIRAHGQEIFFHRTGLQQLNFDSLKEGQTVEFELERGERAYKPRVCARVRLEP